MALSSENTPTSLVHPSFSVFSLPSSLPCFLPWAPFMGRILGCQASLESGGKTSRTRSPVAVCLLNVPKVMALGKSLQEADRHILPCLKALLGDTAAQRPIPPVLIRHLLVISNHQATLLGLWRTDKGFVIPGMVRGPPPAFSTRLGTIPHTQTCRNRLCGLLWCIQTGVPLPVRLC